MTINVYKTIGHRASALTAALVTTEYVDELPANLEDFAIEHGGDVAEIEVEARWQS